MHIAMNGWFWDQPNTGSGQYLRHLVGSLRRLKPDLRISLILPAGVDGADVPAGVTVIRAGGSRSNLGKVWFEQRLFPAAAAWAKADLAHVPYWGAPLASLIPLVTTVLDVIPLALPEYAAGFLPRLYTELQSTAARGSSHTITISDAAKADIVKHLGIADSAITTTHLAADERYHPRIGAERDAAVRAKYKLPDDFILYMGGFDRRKQVNLALLGYSYVAQAEGDAYPLVIAGREPDWGTPLFPDMRQYAATLNIEPQWIGYVDEADKPSLLRLARVFVYPSLYEGFGLPVIEALASGTPVIASDIPVMQEIVGDAAYLVAPDSGRKMGGAMLALVGQEPLRKTMINRGLGRATQFSWRKTALETAAVYERVLGQPTKP